MRKIRMLRNIVNERVGDGKVLACFESPRCRPVRCRLYLLDFSYPELNWYITEVTSRVVDACGCFVEWQWHRANTSVASTRLNRHEKKWAAKIQRLTLCHHLSTSLWHCFRLDLRGLISCNVNVRVDYVSSLEHECSLS